MVKLFLQTAFVTTEYSILDIKVDSWRPGMFSLAIKEGDG